MPIQKSTSPLSMDEGGYKIKDSELEELIDLMKKSWEKRKESGFVRIPKKDAINIIREIEIVEEKLFKKGLIDRYIHIDNHNISPKSFVVSIKRVLELINKELLGIEKLKEINKKEIKDDKIGEGIRKKEIEMEKEDNSAKGKIVKGKEKEKGNIERREKGKSKKGKSKKDMKETIKSLRKLIETNPDLVKKKVLELMENNKSKKLSKEMSIELDEIYLEAVMRSV